MIYKRKQKFIQLENNLGVATPVEKRGYKITIKDLTFHVNKEWRAVEEQTHLYVPLYIEETVNDSIEEKLLKIEKGLEAIYDKIIEAVNDNLKRKSEGVNGQISKE